MAEHTTHLPARTTEAWADTAKEVDARRARLAAIAAGLCQDAGITIHVHDGGWGFDPQRRSIGVPAKDLSIRGEVFCAGVIAHEVGHARITRYHLLLPNGPNPLAWRHVLNAIEDERVERWMKGRYPGIASWLVLVRDEAMRSYRCPPTAFFEAALGAALDAAFDFAEPLERFCRRPEVLEVLGTTRDARRRYVNLLPSVGADEGEVMASALDAFALACDEVVPRFLALWEMAPELNEAIAQEMAGWTIELPAAASPRRASPDAPDALEGYAAIARRMAPHIGRLAQALEAVLTPRRRLGWSRGHETGQRVDLDAIMTHQADPRRPLRPFRRRTIPDRRDVAVSLLVDLSGSMRGPKIAAAQEGICVVAETLARLSIPLRVDGFQDELIPVCDFGEGLGSRLRQILPELNREVSGTRRGGWNRPEFNDDGPCLAEAARHLLAFPAWDRILLVVSDGHPEGRRSNAGDLERAVRRVIAEGVALVGVGLGPGTRHVTRYYPDHLAEVPIERFALDLGRVLAELLLRRV